MVLDDALQCPSEDNTHPVPISLSEETDQFIQSEVLQLPPDYIELKSHVQDILNSLLQLNRKFDNRLAQDMSKERIIDTMHEELQIYRQDIGLKLMLPLVRSVIGLHDDLVGMIGYQLSEPATDAELKMQQAFQDFTAMIRDRLQAHGFNNYTLNDKFFNSKFQQATKKIPTNNPELDQQVASHVKLGFAYDERIIRPEIVTVYRFQEENQER